MAFTAKQVAAQRRSVAAEMRAELRRKDAERLAQLRDAIRDAKLAKKQRLADVRAMCRSGREQVRARAKQLRAELNELIRLEREAARGTCWSNRLEARAEGDRNIKEAKRALKTARADVSRERIWDPSRDPLRRSKGRKAAAREAAVRKSESDDEVRGNIPHELIPVFDAVKRGIQESPRRSRTEAFLEWVQEHPSQVYEIVAKADAEALRRMEAEERRLAREMRTGRRYKGRSSAELAAALADVPF